MDRAKSLVRRNLVLGGLAAALLLVVALRPDTASAVRAKDDLPATFPGFDPAAARRVEVVRTAKKDGKPSETRLRLAPDDGRAWKIDTAWGYPADASRVAAFLEKVKASKEKGGATENAAKFATFGGADGYTEVTVDGVSGKRIAKFGVGKGNAGNLWSDSYLRVDEGGTKATPRIVIATDFQSGAVGADLAPWLEQRLFPGAVTADVTRIEMLQPSKENRTIVLEKGARAAGENEDPWKMTSPQEGKVGAQAAGNLARGFTGLFLSEVVDSASGPEADAKYGFDKPEAVVTVTAKSDKPGVPPTTWKIAVGKKVEGKEHRYVRRTTGGEEQPYVFTVSDWDLRDFQNDPSQFLEKKPDEGKPGEGTEPAMDGATPPAEPTPAPPAMDGAAPPAPPAEPAPAPPPPPPPSMDDAPK